MSSVTSPFGRMRAKADSLPALNTLRVPMPYRANLLSSANDAILADASAPFMPVMAPEPKRRALALGGKRGRRFKARR